MSDHLGAQLDWLLTIRQIAALIVEAVMTVVSFVVIGPPLAATVFVLWETTKYALDVGEPNVAAVAISLPLVMTASYVLGYIPAMFCGVSAAIVNLVVRTGWLRLVAAPLLSLAVIRTSLGWGSGRPFPGGIAGQVAFAVGAFGSVLVVQMARSRPASRDKRR